MKSEAYATTDLQKDLNAKSAEEERVQIRRNSKLRQHETMKQVLKTINFVYVTLPADGNCCIQST